MQETTNGINALNDDTLIVIFGYLSVPEILCLRQARFPISDCGPVSHETADLEETCRNIATTDSVEKCLRFRCATERIPFLGDPDERYSRP